MRFGRLCAVLWVSLLLGPWTALLAATPEADPRQLWQLLDYVAVDYGSAVEGGKVVSEAEYAEMREFADNAHRLVQELRPHPRRPELLAAVERLRAAVQAKAPPAEVARLAGHANAVLLAAYPIPTAPSVVPDLAQGQALYRQQCAGCHGLTGRGDGAAGAGLNPRPIAFADPERARSRSLLALYQAITQGVAGTGMPGFAGLSDAERWNLAFYVGTMSHSDAMREHGRALWQRDAAGRRQLPDMTALATATEAGLAQALTPPQARDLLAYARSEPGVVAAGQPANGLDLARRRLRESLAALDEGKSADAMRLALSAYLDGFEPLEPVLAARNKALLTRIEDAMLAYRASITAGNPQQARAAAGELERLLLQAQGDLQGGAADPAASFLGALTILLREGVEALLIVVGMVAFLRKADRLDAIRAVHAGWVGALAAGALTWAVATYAVSVSGASREITEGLSSIFAAVVLLSVGLWMHQKSAAGRWQSYLREKMSAAASRRSTWALFGLAFIAVYREVFETVLFFSALTADGNGSAVGAGLATGIVLLAMLAWALLKTSARMPIGRFFSASSVLIAVLAVVLAGKGVAGLQEAGWLGATPAALPRIEILGLYPTVETLGAQIAVLLVALVGFTMNAINARRPAPA